MTRKDYNKLVDKYNNLIGMCGDEELQELHLCECDNIPVIIKDPDDDGYYVECQNCKRTTNKVFNEMDSGADIIVIEKWNNEEYYYQPS